MTAGKYNNGTDFASLLFGLRRSAFAAASGAVTINSADPSEPPQVTNLHLSSQDVLDTYLGKHLGIITATWDLVVPDDSETGDPDVSPVTSYYVSYAYGSTGWSRESPTSTDTVTLPGVPIGVEVTVRVRARTQAGVLGPFTTASIVPTSDDQPPPVPSKPDGVGTLRGMAVIWDGTFAGGAAKPPDFAYVVAEVSLSAEFTGQVLKGGVLSEAGMTAVTKLTEQGPFTAYARLRSVDDAGNRSAPSEVFTGGSIPIIAPDIGQKAVTTAALADAAVTAEQILNGAVDTLKLATGAVTVTKLADLSVSVDKIVNGAVTAAKTQLAAIDPASGTLAINSVVTNNIVAGAVTSELIVSDAIIARHIVAGEIISDKIAASAITTEKLNALSVNADKLQANSVETLKVAANAITTSLLAAGAVVADTLAVDAVTGKVITGGTFRTGVPNEDRIEIIDQVVYDDYLGYNRSIRDTIRWIRGYDNALVGEIRGFMGDIGSYGLHLNSHVEIGNAQSVTHMVGRIAAEGQATAFDKIRGGRVTLNIEAMDGLGRNIHFDFPVAMQNVPLVWGVWVNSGGSPSGLHGVWSGLYEVCNIQANASGFDAACLLADGQAPGPGGQVQISYFFADFA